MPNISLASFWEYVQSEPVLANSLQAQRLFLFIIRSLLYESQNQRPSP